MKLFQNLEQLDEKPSDFDSLEYSSEIKNVKNRIDRLVSKNKHSIVAYLGPFGVGKSTILKEVTKQTSNYRWVTFEMWRYANRNELWDGFVIKLASEMSNKNEFEIADDIEGKTLTWKENIPLAIWLAIIFIGSIFVCIIPWLNFRSETTLAAQYIVAYAKYAFPSVLTVMLLVGLSKFFELQFISGKRPLHRVFELEHILLTKIHKMKKPLIVVVEDVDRTTPDGLVFLETLNHFLNNKLSSRSKAFIVIAPQSNNSFDRLENSNNEGLERSLKIYDEKIYFNSDMNDASIKSFYNNIEVDELYKTKLIQSTQVIIGRFKKQITIRLLKHALREVYQFAEMNNNANPVIALSIILSRYVMVTTTTMQRQLGIKTVTEGNAHGSESAKPFFLAIAIGLGEYDEALKANTYILNFSQDNTQIASELFEHPNKTKRYTMTISNIYEQLIV